MSVPIIEAVVERAAADGPRSALAAAARELAVASDVVLEEQALRLFGASPDDPEHSALPPAGRDRLAMEVRDGCADSTRSASRLLGACFEALLDGDQRVAGAHHTSPPVAAYVVDLATRSWVPGGSGPPPTVCDPSVGGGVFLVAVAERLHGLGHDRATIARCLWGFDTDPLAVAVTEAALALWAGGVPSGVAPRLACADFLLADEVDRIAPDGGWSLVVGNPPFQSQLAGRTARDRKRAGSLQAHFGRSARGYVDEAGLFVLAGTRRLQAGGRLALIVPTSLFSADDAAAVRAEVTAEAAIGSVWVPGRQVFAAAVDVAVPVFHRGESPDPVAVVTTSVPEDAVERFQEADPCVVGPPGADWSVLLADAEGVPRVDLDLTTPTIGDRATATAGFRQHFYALAPAVSDGPGGDRRLMTVGLVDPLTSYWGRRGTKMAGSTFEAPLVDSALIEDPEVARWIEGRRRPKILVATQSRVVEALADVDGDLVPSTPLISVEPIDGVGGLWPLLAVLCAPPVTAWFHRRVAGSGLSVGRIRPTAAQLRCVPLPSDGGDWREAARLVEAASAEADDVARRSVLLEVGELMTSAYRSDPEITAWWQGHLPPVRQ